MQKTMVIKSFMTVPYGEGGEGDKKLSNKRHSYIQNIVFYIAAKTSSSLSTVPHPLLLDPFHLLIIHISLRIRVYYETIMLSKLLLILVDFY